MKLRKILALVLTVVLCFGMVSVLASCGGTEEDVMVIGVSGPLTGDYSMYGKAVENAANLAIEEINAIEEKGGEGTLGFKFELVATDDEADYTKVQNNYTNMVSKGMLLSLGTVTTGAGMTYTSLAAKDNMFFLTPSATGDDIPGTAGNGFQMCFADSQQGVLAAEYLLKNYSDKKIGVYYKQGDAYSEGIYEQFMGKLRKENAQIADAVVVAPFTKDDASQAAHVSKLAGCEFIFMPIYYSDAAPFMVEANKGTQIPANAVFYGGDGFDGITSIPNFDINSIKQEITYLTHFTVNAAEGTPAYEFIKKYEAKYDETKEPVNQFGAAAYDCVYAIYAALKFAKANGAEISTDMDASDLCNILKGVLVNDEFEFRGITGEADGEDGRASISWEANGQVTKTPKQEIVKKAS